VHDFYRQIERTGNLFGGQFRLGTSLRNAVEDASTQVDGASAVVAFLAPEHCNQHDDLIIGNVWTDWAHSYTWHGALDDVRIYNRALSADEVACLAAM